MASEKDTLWPLSASLLERWRNGVKWPKANQGNIHEVLCFLNCLSLLGGGFFFLFIKPSDFPFIFIYIGKSLMR